MLRSESYAAPDIPRTVKWGSLDRPSGKRFADAVAGKKQSLPALTAEPVEPCLLGMRLVEKEPAPILSQPFGRVLSDQAGI